MTPIQICSNIWRTCSSEKIVKSFVSRDVKYLLQIMHTFVLNQHSSYLSGKICFNRYKNNCILFSTDTILYKDKSIQCTKFKFTCVCDKVSEIYVFFTLNFIAIFSISKSAMWESHISSDKIWSTIPCTFTCWLTILWVFFIFSLWSSN